MTRLPSRPDLNWKPDGTPVASAFDDVYFSLSDGLEETRNVFLKACGLPERWVDTRHFTVAELGFGSGLNFLGLLDAWQSSEKRSDAWLHFVSVEKYLMSGEDAARVLNRWPDLSDLSSLLLKRWPILTRGVQRIDFPEIRASLTLYIGDVSAWLMTHDFKADAWFLDGFAPAKNDQMWSPELYPLIAQHSAPGCLIGTYTVAGSVRRGLADAGFEVSKQPGFGRKRERLEARWPEHASVQTGPDIYLTQAEAQEFEKVVVIGAGIAGASVARQFADAGYPVEVIDREQKPAEGASGNPLGLVMPRLDAGDTAQARLLIQSYLYALSYYDRLAPDAVTRVNVHQLAGSEKDKIRFSKLLDDPPLDNDWLAANQERDKGLVHHNALLIEPSSVVTSLLDHPKIELKFGNNISHIGDLRSDNSTLTLFVIASGWQSQPLLKEAFMPIAGRLGQVEFSDVADHSGNKKSEAVASGTYALKHNGKLLFGATFEPIDLQDEPMVSDAARSENLGAFYQIAPEWAGEVDENCLQSRASVRATTPDRFPLAGCLFETEAASEALDPLRHGAPVTESVPHFPDVYVLSGLGARGFTFAPLMAASIRAMALSEPSPLARPELEAVSPIRFLVRAIRKGN